MEADRSGAAPNREPEQLSGGALPRLSGRGGAPGLSAGNWHRSGGSSRRRCRRSRQRIPGPGGPERHGGMGRWKTADLYPRRAAPPLRQWRRQEPGFSDAFPERGDRTAIALPERGHRKTVHGTAGPTATSSAVPERQSAGSKEPQGGRPDSATRSAESRPQPDRASLQDPAAVCGWPAAVPAPSGRAGARARSGWLRVKGAAAAGSGLPTAFIRRQAGWRATEISAGLA